MIQCEKFERGDETWDFVVSQVARLERLDKFPFGAEGKRELCFALLTADFTSEAKEIIDRIMQSESTYECPSGPDLRRMINAEHNRGENTATELLSRYKAEDTSIPTTLRQLLDRQMILIKARQKELHDNPVLYRVGSDNRLVRTQLRDELSAATERLRDWWAS